MGVANLLGSLFENVFRLLCGDYSGGLPICRGPFRKLLADFHVEFYYGVANLLGCGDYSGGCQCREILF